VKQLSNSFLTIALLALGAQGVNASTAYGTLNNFDVVNDTERECHGFEIEIEDVHSTDITYTYDWNHYGHPHITDDLSDPAHPKVIIRYESAKNPDGTWASRTAIPGAPITPTNGHSCTNPSVNRGCEHFGVGFYGTSKAIRYNWLVDNGGVLEHHTSPVLVGTPNWNYQPPVGGQPAAVVAVMPAPEVEIRVNKRFGEPSFVKVIKTKTHNANDVALDDLISEDSDADGNPDWQNGEPAEVETAFKLLQTNTKDIADKQELVGQEDDMGDGDKKVTRRYEFYKYAAAANTIDAESGEAMCDEVNPTNDPDDAMYLHGVGTDVEVTDLNGDSYYVDCESQVVVGEYIGAQMAGFAAALPLGLIDHLQDGEKDVEYLSRSVVVGGDSPYDIVPPVGLPPGLSLGDDGVLSGTPTSGGIFNFTVAATDADNVAVSGDYVLTVAGDVVAPQYVVALQKLGAGTGTVAGSGIDCGATCDITLDGGTPVTLTATPAADSKFIGWSGACAGTDACVITVDEDAAVTATFDLLLPPGC
jgi:Putative Ig domain/Divergent InlB B-repeat domain